MVLIPLRYLSINIKILSNMILTIIVTRVIKWNILRKCLIPMVVLIVISAENQYFWLMGLFIVKSVKKIIAFIVQKGDIKILIKVENKGNNKN